MHTAPQADRSRPVKVIGMTHAPEYNNLGTAAMAAALDKYCIENNVTLRWVGACVRVRSATYRMHQVRG